MNIEFYQPTKRLEPFIRYYWVMETKENLNVQTFPIGCPQLIFHRRAPFYIPELNIKQAKFSISGQVNFPAGIQSSGDIETIVVVFHPHAVSSLFNIPVWDFYNQEIDGHSLGDKQLSILAEEVLNVDDSATAVKMIERWLLARLEQSGIYNFNRVGASLKQLFLHNDVSVEEMARVACLCKKQFERVFFNTVGMKPKEYSNVVRFQKSLWLMQNGDRDFTNIACSCHYSDQSHFIRECRRYSGYSPTELLRIQPVYSDLFTSPL